MRNSVGIFGAVAGVIVVALVSRYGFATSDTRLDGAITAFFFAVIAVGGIGGPAVAVHLCRSGKGWGKAWGLIAGAIAFVALLANLSNSLGAIAGRADKTLAERTSAKDATADARAELARLTKQREELPTFVPATPDDVQAARDAVSAAQKAAFAECGDGTNLKQRGPRCRERETTEKSARDALAIVLTNKGLTDRAAKLDADTVAVRSKIEKAPPVAAVNPMAEMLARIFHMQADDAATWQQVATVVVVELLIAFALIAYELLDIPRHNATPTPTEAPKPTASVEPRERAEEDAASVIAERASLEQDQALATAPIDTASVGGFMLACLPRADGERASWGAIYARYRAWCAEHDPPLPPLELPAFGAQFGNICKRVGIRTRSTRKTAYCLDVRLSA